MDNHRDPADIKELLDRIEAGMSNRSQVSIGAMMDSVGRRTFGPVVLLVGLILVAPLSGVPVLPASVRRNIPGQAQPLAPFQLSDHLGPEQQDN